MSENRELEDVEQLVACPGWGRFAEMVDQQWGGNGSRYRDAVTAAARIGSDADAVSQLRQVIAAQREIQNVMAFVGNRIKLLKPQPVTVGGLSRRGGL